MYMTYEKQQLFKKENNPITVFSTDNFSLPATPHPPLTHTHTQSTQICLHNMAVGREVGVGGSYIYILYMQYICLPITKEACYNR